MLVEDCIVQVEEADAQECEESRAWVQQEMFPARSVVDAIHKEEKKMPEAIVEKKIAVKKPIARKPKLTAEQKLVVAVKEIAKLKAELANYKRALKEHDSYRLKAIATFEKIASLAKPAPKSAKKAK